MRTSALVFAGLLWSTGLAAEVRELSQAELREAVRADRALATRSLALGVENYTGGKVVDIRAFLNDDNVFYRFLYQMDNGSIETLLVEAATGRVVSLTSAAGQTVLAFVADNPHAAGGPGNGNGNAFGVGNGNAFGLGNGGNNGAGNGRSNGRGNAGGNSNGNSGGNGGGGGGNGNGNGRNN